MTELGKNPDEILDILKNSGNITYLPVGTKMEISYVNSSNMTETLLRNADEDVLYKTLTEFKEQGVKHIDVTIFNKHAKFDTHIRF